MLKYKIPQIVTLTHVFYVYFAMCQKKNPCKVLIYRDFFVLQFFPAERRGFEPRIPFWGYTRFPGVPLQPLEHLSFSGRKSKGSFRNHQIFGINNLSNTY